MVLIIATVRNQRSAGAVATTLDEDIRFSYNAHSLHWDQFQLKNSGCTSTVQDFMDKFTNMSLNTQKGTPEVSIDTDDLHDFLVLALGITPQHTITTDTDNIPHASSLQYPLSPFPLDWTKAYGAGPEQLIQFRTDVVADLTQEYDTATYDLTVEGVDSETTKPNTLGYVRMRQDAYTAGAVGEEHPTTISSYNRLLGVMNWMTTGYDDLAASAAVDVSGIRFQGVAYSDSMAFRYRPARSWSMKYADTVDTYAAAAAVVNVLDPGQGRFFSDFGINNTTSQVGLGPVANTKIITTAGVAEATRVIPVALV